MDFLDYKQQKDGCYLHFWYRARKELIGWWLKNFYISFSPTRKIFDLGCGCGAELEELKKFGVVDALEINPEAAALAKEQGVRVLIADAQTVSLGQNEYDVVAALDVLEHLEKDQEVLKKLHSSLRTGGRIFITVPAGQFLFSPHDKAMGHWRRYGRAELVKKIAAAGFREADVFYWNSFLFLPVVLFRFFKKLFLPSGASSPDFRLPPRALNELLYIIMKAENWLNHCGLRWPFGVSLVAIAKK